MRRISDTGEHVWSEIQDFKFYEQVQYTERNRKRYVWCDITGETESRQPASGHQGTYIRLFDQCVHSIIWEFEL